jgi:hypothetical protein
MKLLDKSTKDGGVKVSVGTDAENRWRVANLSVREMAGAG